jgi:hypothetical protein
MPISVRRTYYEAIWKDEPQLIVAELDYGFGQVVKIPLPQHFFLEDMPNYNNIAAEGMEKLANALLGYVEFLRDAELSS